MVLTPAALNDASPEDASSDQMPACNLCHRLTRMVQVGLQHARRIPSLRYCFNIGGVRQGPRGGNRQRSGSSP
jgi:hypothetical protein